MFPRATTARLNGSRENAREIDCLLSLPSSPALCADVARQLVVVIVDY